MDQDTNLSEAYAGEKKGAENTNALAARKGTIST